jgi:hypothetical protein
MTTQQTIWWNKKYKNKYLYHLATIYSSIKPDFIKKFLKIKIDKYWLYRWIDTPKFSLEELKIFQKISDNRNLALFYLQDKNRFLANTCKEILTNSKNKILIYDKYNKIKIWI